MSDLRRMTPEERARHLARRNALAPPDVDLPLPGGLCAGRLSPARCEGELLFLDEDDPSLSDLEAYHWERLGVWCSWARPGLNCWTEAEWVLEQARRIEREVRRLMAETEARRALRIGPESLRERVRRGVRVSIPITSIFSGAYDDE